MKQGKSESFLLTVSHLLKIQLFISNIKETNTFRFGMVIALNSLIVDHAENGYLDFHITSVFVISKGQFICSSYVQVMAIADAEKVITIKDMYSILFLLLFSLYVME